MDDRRTFLALATALVPASLITLSAQAQSAASAGVEASGVGRHTFTGPLSDLDTMLIETHPPGGEGRENA